jgi:hypothetical protein
MVYVTIFSFPDDQIKRGAVILFEFLKTDSQPLETSLQTITPSFFFRNYN